MKKIVSIASLFILSSLAQAATPSLDSSLQASIDKFRNKSHVPGLALSVKLPGAADIQDYYSGTSAMGGTDAITKDSLFQIGGVSKSFTAAVVLQLEAEGKLSLDDTLGKWLTQYPDWKAITLRQLLNETSGVFDYLSLPNFVAQMSNVSDPNQANLTIDDMVNMAYNNKPNMASKPGKTWAPSNTNYALLGLIIQTVTKHSFSDEINQRLLSGKLGLTNTYSYPYPQTAQDRLVHGYEADASTDVSHFNMSWGGPAAGLISSSHDIALWSQALFSGQVLQNTQLNEMTSLVSMKNGQPLKADDYKMGVGLGVQAGTDPYDSSYGVVYSYSGNTLGYRAQYVYLPCYDVIVAVTVNNVAQNNKDLTAMMAEVVKSATSSSQWQDYKKTHKPDNLPAVCKKIWS